MGTWFASRALLQETVGFYAWATTPKWEEHSKTYPGIKRCYLILILLLLYVMGLRIPCVGL